jgi:hypothetical protein
MGPSDITGLLDAAYQQADEGEDIDLTPFVRLQYLGSFAHVDGERAADTYEIVVDDYPVPYITVGHQRGNREFHLSLDRRFGLDATLDQLVVWFMANAMAVSAGRTSHGENSNIRNPHGAPGSGWRLQAREPVGEARGY